MIRVLSFYASVLLFLLTFQVRGQNYGVLQLKQSLQVASNDSQRADIYWKLCRDYARIRFDSAFWYGEEAIRIARKEKLSESLAWGLLYTAYVYQQHGNFSLGFSYLYESREIFKNLKPSNLDLAKVYQAFGSAFYSIEDNDSALHYFLKASEFGGNDFLVGVANVYLRVSAPDTAVFLFEKVFRTSRDEVIKMRALAGAGDAFMSINKFDTARYLLDECLKRSNRFGTRIITERCYRILSMTYLGLKKNLEAKKLIYEAVAISESIGSIQNQANGYNLLASLAFEEGDYNECIRQSLRAMEIGEREGFYYIVQAAALNLFKTSLITGNKVAARNYENQFQTAMNLKNKKRNNESVLHYQIRYEALKKEKENVELRNIGFRNEALISQQRNITWFISAGLFIVILISIFLYHQYLVNKKNAIIFAKKNEEIEKQKEVIAQSLKEREEAQAMMVHNEKMASLGQLVAGIAHELNNPLNFISSGSVSLQNELEALKKQFSENDLTEKTSQMANESNSAWGDVDTLINTIRIGSERVMKIVSGLRVFTYHLPEKVQRVNLNDSLDATLTILQSELKGRIHVSKEYQSAPLIECNISEINQVLLNVLMNSIQAIQGEGNIWIKVIYEEAIKMVCVSVRDDGSGIPENLMSRVFEPFFTTKSIGKGSGLGLSISHKIIENHKGIFELRSKVGIGTDATIKLPLRQLKTDPI